MDDEDPESEEKKLSPAVLPMYLKDTVVALRTKSKSSNVAPYWLGITVANIYDDDKKFSTIFLAKKKGEERKYKIWHKDSVLQDAPPNTAIIPVSVDIEETDGEFCISESSHKAILSYLKNPTAIELHDENDDEEDVDTADEENFQDDDDDENQENDTQNHGGDMDVDEDEKG